MEFVLVLVYLACVALVLLFFRGASVLNRDEESAPPAELSRGDVQGMPEDDRQLPLPMIR